MTEACCDARLDLAEPDERDETADWTEPGRRSMVELSTRPRCEREADEGGDADERELAETTDILMQSVSRDASLQAIGCHSAIEARCRLKGHAALEQSVTQVTRVDWLSWRLGAWPSSYRSRACKAAPLSIWLRFVASQWRGDRLMRA